MSFTESESIIKQDNFELRIKYTTKASLRKEYLKLFNIIEIILRDNFEYDTKSLFEIKRNLEEINIINGKCKNFLKEIENHDYSDHEDLIFVKNTFREYFKKYFKN